MNGFVRLVGENRAVEFLGIKLVGFNAENGKKLLFTILVIVLMMLLSKLLRTVARGATKRGERIAFWVRQGIHSAPP